jgi:hypothetical protein
MVSAGDDRKRKGKDDNREKKIETVGRLSMPGFKLCQVPGRGVSGRSGHRAEAKSVVYCRVDGHDDLSENVALKKPLDGIGLNWTRPRFLGYEKNDVSVTKI